MSNPRNFEKLGISSKYRCLVKHSLITQDKYLVYTTSVTASCGKASFVFVYLPCWFYMGLT